MECAIAILLILAVAALAGWLLTIIGVFFWAGFLGSLICLSLGFFLTAFWN